MSKELEKSEEQVDHSRIFLSDDWDPVMGVLSELLFVILPLLVLSIVFLYKGRSAYDLLSSPEWSFGAAVLVGQAVVKFASGVARMGTKARERFAVVISAVIVIELVPSLIILALILTTDLVSTGLVWAQMGIFFFAVVTFLFFGSAGHYILSGKMDHKDARE